MRSLVLGAVVTLCGCAATVEQQPYVSPGVVAPTNSAVDVAAYNLEIKRQGINYYCGSGNCDTLPVLLRAYAPIYPQVELEAGRSDEHTSELQSLMRISYAVFCWNKKNTHR